MYHSEFMDSRVARFFFNHGINDSVPSGEAISVGGGISNRRVVDEPERGFDVGVDLVFFKVLNAGWVN